MPPISISRSAPSSTLCTFLYPSLSTTKSFPRPASRIRARVTSASVHSLACRNKRTASHGTRDANTIPSTTTQQRCFTTSQSSFRDINPMAGVKQPAMSFQSARTMLREQQEKSSVPDDVGLFENTLIMPTGASKPSFFRDTRLRLALERYRLKIRISDFSRVVVFKFSFGKPRPILALRKSGQIARALHAEMYSALAAGNLSTIRNICTDGLAKQFTRRITNRAPGEKYTWKALRYFGRPRVVSHKATLIPVPGRTLGQRQVVVRIESEQELRRAVEESGKAKGKSKAKPKTEENEESGKRERKVEYLVVQQRFSKEDGAGPWKVWGTVTENGWKELLDRAGYFKAI